MPPRPKNTKEEIAAAAFETIKEEGLEALSARQLGKKLGCSAGSIFTVLPSMEHVRMAARELALAEFMEYISDYRQYTPAFKRIGMMIVMYGKHQPELFKLLFMQEHKEAQSFEETIKDLGEVYEVCIELIMSAYEFEKEEAKYLFEQMWTLAYGLGTMCAMKVCSLTEEEIGQRLGALFMSLFMFIKSGKMKEVINAPKELTNGENDGYEVSKLFQKLFADA